MSNAIERAIEFFTALDKGKHIHGIPAPTGIIAELTAHRAKIDSLREYCREQVDNINKIGDLDIIDVMKRTIYRDMLNKLKELEAKQCQQTGENIIKPTEKKS